MGTPKQDILNVFQDNEPHHINGIADETGYARQTVSTYIDELLNDGKIKFLKTIGTAKLYILNEDQ